MTKISYSGYRFPPEIIHQAIWLYLRFTLSFRDVEDLLAERGIAISYETVRRWVNHFGPVIAAELRKRRPKPHSVWHLDEVYLRIDGRMVYLWRAVDAEGEVLDVLVQSRRNKHAALKLMRKLLGVIVDSSRNPTLRRSGRGWASLPQPISLCYLGGGLAEQGPWNVDQRESSSLLWQFVGVGFDDDLNSFFAGVDFDPHGAVFKIDFVPAA
jgi:hypothetical protein